MQIPRGLQTGRQRDVDIPTAPPFCGLEKETNQVVDQSSTSRASAMPKTATAERIPGTTQPIPEKGVSNGIGKFEKQESTLPNKTIRYCVLVPMVYQICLFFPCAKIVVWHVFSTLTIIFTKFRLISLRVYPPIIVGLVLLVLMLAFHPWAQFLLAFPLSMSGSVMQVCC